MTGTAWSAGVPPSRATVSCAGAEHTVEWRAGALHLLDHTEDLEAERALGALSGEPPACLELLSSWQRHAEDPDVLILGPRSHGVLPAARDRRAILARQTRGAAAARPPGPPQEPRTGLPGLLELGGAIPQRLVATVASALIPRRGEPAIAAALDAALYGRVLATLRLWDPHPEDGWELELEMADGQPALSMRPGRYVARLPSAWLIEVWARELGHLNGQFTLTAEPDPSGGWSLTSVDHAMNVNTRTLTL